MDIDVTKTICELISKRGQRKAEEASQTFKKLSPNSTKRTVDYIVELMEA